MSCEGIKVLKSNHTYKMFVIHYDSYVSWNAERNVSCCALYFQLTPWNDFSYFHRDIVDSPMKFKSIPLKVSQIYARRSENVFDRENIEESIFWEFKSDVADIILQYVSVWVFFKIKWWRPWNSSRTNKKLSVWISCSLNIFCFAPSYNKWFAD